MKQILFFSTTFLLLLSVAQPTVSPPKMTKDLMNYCASLPEEFADISAERQASLQELGQYLYEQAKAGEDTKVTVICTHNSRRSHIGQLWFQVAAEWYGIEGVQAYSGGTESTAFNPRAVAALNRVGFRIGSLDNKDNTTYNASWHRGSRPASRLLMFSKKYDHSMNPTEGFAAVMVCSDADKSCPVVPGAEARFAIPFDDPRHFDNTPSEEMAYDKTCRLIARDIFYAMSYAKELQVLDAERSK